MKKIELEIKTIDNSMIEHVGNGYLLAIGVCWN